LPFWIAKLDAGLFMQSKYEFFVARLHVGVGLMVDGFGWKIDKYDFCDSAGMIYPTEQM
jgi:hypothetical protein